MGKRLGFRGRLMLAMMTLVIITSVAIAGLMMLNLFEEEKARADRQLEVAENVAQQTIESRTELVISSLEVVVQDFGFRSAIASRDLPTITSALENHASRAGADLAMLADSQGQLIANLQGLENETAIPFMELLDRASRKGSTSQIRLWNDDAYQVLMVPVSGPGLRAWLAAGFQLNQGFADFISELTRTEVLFTRSVNGEVRLLAGSQGIQAHDAFSADATNHMPYFSRTVQLGTQTGNEVNLQVLTGRDEALESYYRLALETLALVMGALAVAVLLVMLTARTLGRPLLELADFAGAIGEGRDVTPPPHRGGGEMSVLRQALTNMRLQIVEREQRLAHNAFHDDLTELPNRKFLEQELRNSFQQTRRHRLLAISIIDFDAINQSLGFQVGDQILIATGLRLRGLLPVTSILARTGGNEFIALLDDVSEQELDKLLVQLRNECESTTFIDDSPIKPHIAIASLSLPDDAASQDEVRRRVTLTLQLAESNTRRYARYESGGDSRHLRELQLIRDLEQAINQGDLYMNYQPKIDLDQMTFVQVEALVRWRHSELGFINPEEFISLAERSGQTRELTRAIMAQIVSDSAQWHIELPHIGIAINLSALDLGDPELPDAIAQVFSDWHGRMDRLTFEITESALMRDPEAALTTLYRLRDMGVKLSVDDFGTGYSSLAQLRQLPVTELKIDKSFVLELDTQSQDQLIVRSTIDLAHGLGLSVVAEGIENEQSLTLLRSWQCEKAQGFFLARPMASDQLCQWAEDFVTWAATNTAPPPPPKSE